MKQTLKRRICAAILCHILLLGLVGCGKANKAKLNDGGDPPVKASVDALKQGQPAADSEETVDGAESLARVRGDLEYDGRLTGAAAYLGLREKGDQTELTDWLRENCADLTSELPFLLEIPSERVLGAGYGNLFLPTDEDGAPLLYDFAIYGYTTGLDYPEGWKPSGDDWWWPPTELGLADTSWLCDSWVLELRGGDAGPGYAGTADLYYSPTGRIEQDYLGVWRMEDDCLYLKLSADSGDAIDASFQSSFPPPARIFISSARARARGSPSCRTARTPSDCSCIQGKTAGASSAGLYSLHSACGISSQRRGGPAAAPCAVERDADDGRHCPEDDVIGHKRDERDGKKQQERKAPV